MVRATSRVGDKLKTQLTSDTVEETELPASRLQWCRACRRAHDTAMIPEYQTIETVIRILIGEDQVEDQ